MMQLLLKSRNFFAFLLLLLLVTVSCEKTQDSQVPNIPFTFTVNLDIANELRIPGNSMFFPGVGYGGVIVYCELEDSYYAYDATCTYEVSQGCKIKNEGVLGTCSCCDSKFILIGGAFPTSGPAAAPLRQYHVSIVNRSTLRVYN